MSAVEVIATGIVMRVDEDRSKFEQWLRSVARARE